MDLEDGFTLKGMLCCAVFVLHSSESRVSQMAIEVLLVLHAHAS
jgi:hypothetical protein